MSLMESGSDNQSEQQSSTRMSRVVAGLVVLGLVGSAFLLGRGSVTASVSQSVQLQRPYTCPDLPSPPAPANTPATTPAHFNAAIAALPAGANAQQIYDLCRRFRACNPTLQAFIDQNDLCNPCEPMPDEVELKNRFRDFLGAGQGTMREVCERFRNRCQNAIPIINFWRECRETSPCDGGAIPVCEPPPQVGNDWRQTPNLGRQFSCMTAGKPEVEMMKICALFREHCPSPLDREWLDSRPRCNQRIPRHDGRLDYITREKFENAAR